MDKTLTSLARRLNPMFSLTDERTGKIVARGSLESLRRIAAELVHGGAETTYAIEPSTAREKILADCV